MLALQKRVGYISVAECVDRLRDGALLSYWPDKDTDPELVRIFTPQQVDAVLKREDLDAVMKSHGIFKRELTLTGCASGMYLLGKYKRGRRPV